MKVKMKEVEIDIKWWIIIIIVFTIIIAFKVNSDEAINLVKQIMDKWID